MKKFSFMLVFALIATLAYAQKKPLDHSVYDSWKSLNAVSVPRNGDILIYNINPGEGDTELVIENIRTGKKTIVPRATRAKLSEDGSKVVAVIKPLFEQTRQAKIKKAKKEDMPKDTLALIDVKSGNVEKFANLKSHATADKWSTYLAFELTPAKEKADKKAPKADAKDDKKKPAPKKEVNKLLVMNVLTNKVDTIKNVTSYKFNEDGSWLAYVVEPSSTALLSPLAGL